MKNEEKKNTRGCKFWYKYRKNILIGSPCLANNGSFAKREAINHLYTILNYEIGLYRYDPSRKESNKNIQINFLGKSHLQRHAPLTRSIWLTNV